VLKAVAARDREKTKQFAHKWGYQSHYTDWKQLVADRGSLKPGKRSYVTSRWHEIGRKRIRG
jgi:hypothetical protein